MEQAAEAADKAWRESESYAEVLGKLSGSRVEAQSIQNSIDRLKEHLVEVDESDEWLEATLREFHSRQEKLHQGEETLKRRYLNLQREMEGLRQKGGSAQAKVGAHKKDREHYELQIVRRQDLVKSIARQNSLRGFENQLDDQSFTEFMSAIERLARERKDALNRAKEAAQVELGQVQSVLNELEKKKSGLDEAKKLAKRQIIQNNREAEKCQNQLNDIDVDEGRKVTLQSRAQETERALSQAKESAKATSWETKIGEKAAELQRQEDINARLNTELITATERAGDLARLDLLKQELKDRERSLETMTHTHNDRLKELLGREWEPSTLEKIFQERQREANQDLYSAERDRDGISRDLDQIEDKLKVTKQSLREDQSEARQLAEKITEVISDEPSAFPAVLSAREEQLSNAKEEADIFFGRNKYFEMCIQTAEEKNACRTCMRKFKTGEAQNLIAKLQKWIQEGTAQNIRDFEEDVQAAKNLSSDYERWSRLTSHEIPASEKEIKGLESQRGPLVAEAEKHDKKVLDCTEFKRELESLSKTVSSIARYEGEIVMFKKQIEELSGKQQTGSGRTLTEIREEITTVADVIRALQRDIEQLKQSRQESQNEVNILELRLRDTNSDLNEVLHQLEKQSSIASQIEGYKHKNSELRESIAASDKEIDELLPEIINTQAKYDDISSRADARRSELEKQVSQISENIFQINMASQDINSYIERGGDRQLEEAEMQLVSINSDIAELERQQGELTKEINQLTSEIQDSKNTERKYSDNLQYRQLQTKLQEVNQVIDSLSSQNAEVDRDRFVRESEKWSRRHTTLSALCASKKGEMKSKDNQLVELSKDWEVDYKDAKFRYKEAHVKVAVTKATIDDLKRYGGALDNAIMQYHSLKMEEINRIIEELWQKTYKGTDVDTVLIRSDNETARGNRSYNYRVCMVKGDAEMDMRGRCSAGQKMLASIIIRLALAECFGVNCGLITLDEPTTNLDARNICSLAESLHDIIRERRQQANFQLIVITHDEEFLRAMKCGEFCDHYYRISRDERQKSKIEKQSIMEVM